VIKGRREWLDVNHKYPTVVMVLGHDRKWWEHACAIYNQINPDHAYRTQAAFRVFDTFSFRESSYWDASLEQDSYYYFIAVEAWYDHHPRFKEFALENPQGQESGVVVSP
jgi:hypothetical protein